MPKLTRRSLLNLAAGTAAAAFVPTAWTAATAAAIEEEAFVRIGGIDQWVAIRGRDRSRLPMLFLHGGPCEAESPFLSVFAPWEERYVVAQWDQRGTGRTFGKSGTPPNMTMEQLTQDAIEVTHYVLKPSKGAQADSGWILLGGRIGSQCDPRQARAVPCLCRYGSTHQWQGYLREHAVVRRRSGGSGWRRPGRRANSNSSRCPTLRTWPSSTPSSDGPRLFPTPVLTGTISARCSALLGSPDKPKSAAAADFFASNPPPDNPAAHPVCLQKLLPYASEFDARAGGLDLKVPYFVIQGRNDPRCPPEAAREFVNEVHAPAKNFTTIDGGHFACLSNPNGFLNALDSDIRQLGLR